MAYNHTTEEYLERHGGKFVPQDFYYASDNNESWETVESLREKFKKIIPGFEVK